MNSPVFFLRRPDSPDCLGFRRTGVGRGQSLIPHDRGDEAVPQSRGYGRGGYSSRFFKYGWRKGEG